jgi:protein-S-isoprenylcysteine O-methyltransferase Ste14
VRNAPLPEPHLIGLGAGVIGGVLVPWNLPLPPGLRLAGVCLAGGGLLLAAWATLASSDTKLANPGQLVIRGPYAFSRNPMYVGWTLAYVGVALGIANVWLAVFLPGVLLLTHVVVCREEKLLHARFGAEYGSYITRVRRYL